MGIFGARPEDAEPKLKQLKRALKAAGKVFTIQQIAYATWTAQAADNPDMAASHLGMRSQLELTPAELSAVQAVLTEVGV